MSPEPSSRLYWCWLATLVVVAAVGVSAWLRQLDTGLAVTGLGRDVSWGLYIAQFTFLVGIAASAVTVVLPYYLHDCKAFAPLAVLGELLAIAAVTCAGLFIAVDMGQPTRVLNVLRYPSLRSLMFWDMLSLGGYLALNAAIAWKTLSSERHDLPASGWVRPLIIISIPWAVSIHTVTAFLYSGLPGRSFWLTALLAPRFLASAFASGPALLVLVALLLRRVAGWDPGEAGVRRLLVIVAYALAAHLFFLGVELFTVFYSQVPAHVEPFRYLLADGHPTLAAAMWVSIVLAVTALAALLVPACRQRPVVRALAAAAVLVALWIDKGFSLIVGGFVPTPLAAIVDYRPTGTEIEITLGIWAVGAFMVTVFYALVIRIRRDTEVVDSVRQA
ncbi:MAG: sulfate reduction electron transfer complex DsrMKJOP subunit DsrP [Bacteroidales bacterium]